MSIDVNYVTSSPYKREEIGAIADVVNLSDGRAARDVFEFHVLSLSIKEHLEIDIATMVMAEVSNAYSQLKIPCIVEHAGLVFDKHLGRGYPGGLTKPMWDTLGEDFVSETNSANSRAIARACVAYCDGMSVHMFTGETSGRIAVAPRGSRAFYWDTIFIPDVPNDANANRTYAEIVEQEGVAGKMRLSQSAKALAAFMEYRVENQPLLWPS